MSRTLKGLIASYEKKCRATLSSLDAKAHLLPAPYQPAAADSLGMAFLKAAGSVGDDPRPALKALRKHALDGLKEAEQDLLEAEQQLHVFRKTVEYLRIGVLSEDMPEPWRSNIRTVLEGQKCGLIDANALARQLQDILSQAGEPLKAARKAGRRYASTCGIILLKCNIRHLQNFPKWRDGIPGLEQKLARRKRIHNLAFPSKPGITRRGRKAAT